MIKESEVLLQVEGLTVTRLHVCVEQSWVKPAQGDSGFLFDRLDVARLRLICELSEDLAVNDDALPLVLSLIDQKHSLERRLRFLAQAISEQDEAVRERLAARLQDQDVE
jgi:chaperone modulatory protein CbpM